MKICRKCGAKEENEVLFICSECGGPLRTIKSNPFTEGKFGIFHVNLDSVTDNYEELLKLLQECFITRCEYLYHMGVFNITAVHPSFEKMKEGQPPELYDIMYHEDKLEYFFRNVKKREVN